MTADPRCSGCTGVLDCSRGIHRPRGRVWWLWSAHAEPFVLDLSRWREPCHVLVDGGVRADRPCLGSGVDRSRDRHRRGAADSHVRDQVVNVGAVPDARISARFTWWFETKTARGGYAAEGHDRDQLRNHSKQLHDDPDASLFVLTPDPVQPAWFEALDGVDVSVRGQIVWLSFLNL